MSIHTERTPESDYEPFRNILGLPWKILLGLGVGAVVVGVIVLAWPGQTTLVAGVLFGIYLLVLGFTQLFMGFSAHMSGGVRALTLISGALAIILGLFCFRDDFQAIILLAVWIGIGWVFAGVGRLFSAGLPQVPTFLAILEGLLFLLGGAILIATPIESLTTLIWVTGILLVVLGITEIVHAFQLRKVLPGTR